MYPFKTVRPFQPGDRVRYGTWKGKGRSLYIVVHATRQTVTVQHEGSDEMVLVSGETVLLNISKPGIKRIPVSQSHDLLTLLTSHEVR